MEKQYITRTLGERITPSSTGWRISVEHHDEDNGTLVLGTLTDNPHECDELAEHNFNVLVDAIADVLAASPGVVAALRKRGAV